MGRATPEQEGARRWASQGSACYLQGRFAEAAAAYREAIRLDPDHLGARSNLAVALAGLGDYHEAEAVLQRALALRPDHVGAWGNLGIMLKEQGRFSEALDCYAEAIRLDPNLAEAHRGRSHVWLLLGDLERGFAEYEWRVNGPRFPILEVRQPLWDGSPLNGRTILIHDEQGMGDTLQFIRYAPIVQERGGRVVVLADETLHPILSRCEGIDRLISWDGPLPEFDVYSPLMSLPRVLGTTLATIPATIPYLHADPDRVERWGRELGAVRDFKIGIAWQGSRGYNRDIERSIPLRHFEPLAHLPGVRLFSLQKGDGTEQLAEIAGKFAVNDLGTRLDNDSGAFMDTAAVLKTLDLVITCDTSIGHLAGGLGVPAWIAMSFVPDWRWLLDRDDSPWYPTVRLFRQARRGDWGEVFQRISEAVRRKQAEREAGTTGPAFPI